MKIICDQNFPVQGNTYKLLMLDNGSSYGNRSALRKSFFTQIRQEKPVKGNDYPVIFWTREDFIENSMEVLFNDISKN